MSVYEDRIAKHPATVGLTETEDALDALAALMNGTESERLSRTKLAVGSVRERIREADSSLLSPLLLQDLQGPINQLKASIDAAAALARDGGREAVPTTQVDTIDSQVDEMLKAAAFLPAAKLEADAAVMRQSAEFFRDEINRLLDGLTPRIDEAKRQVASTAEKAAETDQERTEALEELKAEIQTLGTTIESQRTALNEALESHRSSFSKAQESREESFRTAQQQAREEVDQQIAKFKTDTEALRTKASADAEELLDSIRKHDKDADDLLGAIGRKGTTLGYREFADKESAASTLWRWVTVAFGLGSVAVLVFFIATSHGRSHIEPGLVAAELSLSAALGGLATYAGRLAAQHRRLAVHERSLELAIAQLSPFLAPLEPDVQKQVLEAFAFYFFTLGVPAEKDAESVTTAGPSNPVLQQFGKILEQIVARRTSDS